MSIVGTFQRSSPKPLGKIGVSTSTASWCVIVSLEEFSEEKIIYIFQGIRGHNQGFKVTIIRRIKDLVKHPGWKWLFKEMVNGS